MLANVGMSGKYAFKKPPVTSVQRKVSYIVSVVALALCIVILCIPVMMTDSVDLQKGKEITIGMSKDEVTEIMGEADDESNTIYRWYSAAYAKLLREYAELEESGDFSSFEEMLKLEEEMEETAAERLTVYFDSEGRVTQVRYTPDIHKESTNANMTDNNVKMLDPDGGSSYLQADVYAEYSDGSWSRQKASTYYSSMELVSLEDEEFSARWVVRFDGEDLVTGEIPAITAREMEDEYGSRFTNQFMYDYNYSYGRDFIEDASREEAEMYADLMARYGVNVTL